MKTFRFHFVLMILQACLVIEMSAKECTVAGISTHTEADVVLKNFYGSHTTSPDSSGHFIFRISIDSPQYFDLTTDKTMHIFLIPGDSIFVDPDNNPHINPANGSAISSNYLVTWYASTDSMLTNFDRTVFYSKDPASFTAAVTKLHDRLAAPLQQLVAQDPSVNKEFVRIENERINFWAWCPLNRYEYRYQLYTGKKAQLPGNFYEYLHTANFNDPSFLQLSDFDDFTSTYLEMKSYTASQQNEKSYQDPYFTTKVLLAAIQETFANQSVRENILYEKMWGQIYYMDINDSLFAIVVNTLKDPKHINGLTKLYTSLQKFQAGRFAPEFTLMDATDRQYTLQDFKGRYLLIDVWGVYCGPCIKELPTLKEIEAEFHDANIAFIAVNLDGTKDKWIDRVKELKLQGLQLMPPQGWDSAFRKAYEIDQVPTFILIDREGRFIDSRAKLPTEGLRLVLKSLPSIRN
jgi:thiol-disulfide isomerase/thioredoxin